MDLGIIVAIANNGIIGAKGKLPWKKKEVPGDLARFERLTKGNPIIMGRKTHDSIGFRLPGRTNIVITRGEIEHEGIYTARTLDEALEIASGSNSTDGRVYVMGGSGVYEEAIKQATFMEITRIKKDYEGDTKFPEVDWNQWDLTWYVPGETHDYETYERK